MSFVDFSQSCHWGRCETAWREVCSGVKGAIEEVIDEAIYETTYTVSLFVDCISQYFELIKRYIAITR